MTANPPFPVEPWAVREPMLDLDRLAVTESVMALSNGHIGLRGNLDEASRTASPAPTSTRSTRPGRCRTRRPATATPSPARPSSTSPTAS
jgi:hypothetical protein